MKTYVIMISKSYPKTHPKSGQHTCFLSNIIKRNKIHTIRTNYDLWLKRIAEVQDGKAKISLREWSGKPYRSKQLILKELTANDGVGLEKVYIRFETWCNVVPVHNRLNYKLGVRAEEIAENDGLTLQDFKDWFKGADLAEPLAIIHFTQFRYENLQRDF